MSKINLKISEAEFWSYSPRKIFSLIIEFNEMNKKEEEKKPRQSKPVRRGGAELLDAMLGI